MSQNQLPSLLDSGQIIKRVFDGTNDAVRVEIGQGTSFAIGLSADSGDSILTVPTLLEAKASITSTNSGVIIPVTSCTGMKSFSIYTHTTSTITGAQLCTVEVSPSDSDNVWIATSATITPSATSGAVVTSSISTQVARRIRVSIAAAISSGTFDIYLLGQSV